MTDQVFGQADPIARTIFAQASGLGAAGVAVIRLSGPDAGKAAVALTRKPLPPPRLASLRRLVDPSRHEPIDRGLLLWFPGPSSFTGEDVLEFHLHGGPAVVAALQDALGRLPGLRPAVAGEFSRRAFMNGKLDLTAVEGLADLIAAETGAQARQALRQMDGELGRLYERWRTALLSMLARIEAAIDFAQEEDLPDDLVASITPTLQRLIGEIGEHLSDRRRGERLRNGLVVALIGAPNVGKSSLLNRLARRDVAIVTARPGTTRDILDVPLDLDGYPLTICDMAGLRDADDDIEAEGIKRAYARAAAADLRLVMLDGMHWPMIDPKTAAMIDGDTVIVVNKADVADLPRPLHVRGREALPISCLDGGGFDRLIARLTKEATARLVAGEAPALTRSRHRVALGEVKTALEAFCAAGAKTDLALRGEDLRLATQALGRITGRLGIEDVLDQIFSEFCIGK